MTTQLQAKPGDLYINASRSALKYVTPERDVIVEPVDANGFTRIYVDVTPSAAAEHMTRSRRFIMLCAVIIFIATIALIRVVGSFLESNNAIWIIPLAACCSVSPLISVYGRDVYDKFLAPTSHYIVVRNNTAPDVRNDTSVNVVRRLKLGSFIEARVVSQAKPRTIDAPGASSEYDAISMVVVLLNARKHTCSEDTLGLINQAINAILEERNENDVVSRYNLALAAVDRDNDPQA